MIHEYTTEKNKRNDDMNINTKNTEGHISYFKTIIKPNATWNITNKKCLDST